MKHKKTKRVGNTEVGCDYLPFSVIGLATAAFLAPWDVMGCTKTERRVPGDLSNSRPGRRNRLRAQPGSGGVRRRVVAYLNTG